MAEITVGQLAQQTNKEVSTLLKQLKSFGIEKSSEKDTLTPEEMKTLLDKINSAKNTVTRKKVTSLKLDGKHKINVSVKKKRRVAKKVEEQSPAKVEESIVEKPQAAVDVKDNKAVESVERDSVNLVQPQQEKPVTKPVIKDNGFKITAMPEVKIHRKNSIK